MRIALHAPPRGTPVSVDALADHILETNADLFVAPEYFLQDLSPAGIYDGYVELAPIRKSRRDDFVESLCEETKDLDTLIIPGTIMWYTPERSCYNSTTVIHKGKVIMERFKENEALSDRAMVELAGKVFSPKNQKPTFVHDTFLFSTKKTNPTFVHEGLSYRLDVCLDTLKQTDKNEYDIHIAICSRMPIDLFKENPRARMRGMFIAVDNKEREQSRRLGKALTKPTEWQHYHMPTAAESYTHTDVFEVEL